MPNANAEDRLQQLMMELELAWTSTREDRLVDKLAAKYPEYAEELYEFFADLVEAELDLDQPRPELAAADARVRAWLEREGHRQVEAARRASATGQTPTPTPGPMSAPVPTEPARPGGPGPPRPFVGLLRSVTGQNISALAVALDVTPGFLLDVSEHGDVLSEAARVEFADRAERTLHVDRRQSIAALRMSGREFQKAASRGKPYQARQVTYPELVRRSDLAAEQKQYWLGLV